MANEKRLIDYEQAGIAGEMKQINLRRRHAENGHKRKAD